MNTKDYIFINKSTYDVVAYESYGRQLQRSGSIRQLIARYICCLELGYGPGPYSLLELGPGAGVAILTLTQAGYEVTAIELSGQTALLAQQTAPRAKVITGEFLSFDFGKERFDGICAIAFIHLFPQVDAVRVLQKIHCYDQMESYFFQRRSTTS